MDHIVMDVYGLEDVALETSDLSIKWRPTMRHNDQGGREGNDLTDFQGPHYGYHFQGGPNVDCIPPVITRTGRTYLMTNMGPSDSGINYKGR